MHVLQLFVVCGAYIPNYIIATLCRNCTKAQFHSSENVFIGTMTV